MPALPRSACLALVLSIAAVPIAGCGAPVALRTQAQPVSACMDALAIGTLVASNRSGLALRAADGTILEVEWPFGYSARRDAAGLALLDATGVAIAYEGQQVQMGGGSGADSAFHACPGSVSVVTPEATTDVAE